jgi:hypothetical protein
MEESRSIGIAVSPNLVALPRMATGRVAEAVPVFEDLVERVPDMTLPVANLLRAQASSRIVRRWTDCWILRHDAPLRDFQGGLAFIHQARPYDREHRCHPGRTCSALHQVGMRRRLAARVRSARRSGRGSYRTAETACLGPCGTEDDIIGPDGWAVVPR